MWCTVNQTVTYVTSKLRSKNQRCNRNWNICKDGRITRATANKALDYLQNIEEQLNLVL